MQKFKILLYEEMHEVGKALLREKAEIFFATSLTRVHVDQRGDGDGRDHHPG